VIESVFDWAEELDERERERERERNAEEQVRSVWSRRSSE
jgi:hypothetical protein